MYRACQHIKPNGLRCQSPAMRRNAFCYFHSKAHGSTRTSSRDDLLLPIAEGHAAVQLAVHQIIQALLARQIDAKEAGTMLYGIQIASQHIKVEAEDPTDSECFFAKSGKAEELAIPLCIEEDEDVDDDQNCSNCGQRFNCRDYEPDKEDKERYQSLADLSDDETPADDPEEDAEEDAEKDSEEGTEKTGKEIPAEIAAQSAEETGRDPIESLVSGHDLSHAEEPRQGATVLKGHDFSRAEEPRQGATVLKGHDFSRAEQAPQLIRALAPEESLVSGQGFSRSENESPVSGHDFSRAEKTPKMDRALAPEGSLPQCDSTDGAAESESILENVAAVCAQQKVPNDSPRKRRPHAPKKCMGVKTSPTIKPTDAIALFKAFIKLNSVS